jgi:hypothetical protein
VPIFNGQRFKIRKKHDKMRDGAGNTEMANKRTWRNGGGTAGEGDWHSFLMTIAGLAPDG